MIVVLAAGFGLVVNTVQVSAATIDEYEIGVNDKVSIYGDEEQEKVLLKFSTPKDGAISFTISSDKKVSRDIVLMKKAKNGEYVKI